MSHDITKLTSKTTTKIARVAIAAALRKALQMEVKEIQPFW